MQSILQLLEKHAPLFKVLIIQENNMYGSKTAYVQLTGHLIGYQWNDLTSCGMINKFNLKGLIVTVI